MIGNMSALPIDPWEHTATKAEWEAGSATPPPAYEPEELWRCDSCGRDFTIASRMVAHLTHAHGWGKLRALRACGLGESREARPR